MYRPGRVHVDNASRAQKARRVPVGRRSLVRTHGYGPIPVPLQLPASQENSWQDPSLGWVVQHPRAADPIPAEPPPHRAVSSGESDSDLRGWQSPL